MVGPVEVVGADDVGDLVPGGGIDAAARRARPARPRPNAAAPAHRRIDAAVACHACANGSGPAMRCGARRALQARPALRRRCSPCSGTSTSVCRCSATLCSPTVRIGPAGRRTSLRDELMALRRAGLGDVAGADRAEQLAFGAGLGGDRQPKSCSASARVLRAAPGRSFAACSSSARRASKRCDVRRRRQRRLALRQQEIAAVAALHLDAIADVAEVGDFLQQNDFHG